MFKVKNWEKYQHYKPKFASKGEPVKPVWIKFYISTLDDYQFHSLPLEARAALPLLWLMASESNGIIPEPSEIAFRLRMSLTELDIALKALISKGFLENLDLFYNDSIREEKRIEEKRRDKKESIVFVSADAKTENEKNLKPKSEKGKRLRAFLDAETEPVVCKRWGGWAQDQGMDEIFINEQMHMFEDYWNAIPGQKGIKLDWDGTWRNWCRKAFKQKKEKEMRDGLFQQRFIPKGR